jgi:hypothetical protein
MTAAGRQWRGCDESGGVFGLRMNVRARRYVEMVGKERKTERPMFSFELAVERFLLCFARGINVR